MTTIRPQIPSAVSATVTATAYWTVEPGRGELRRHEIAGPGPGEVLVRTLHSGISRGTELLVHRGEVPPSVRAMMRAPFQEGDLPGPVKYGYLSVGVVDAVGAGVADRDLLGRVVFCLHPHQDRYVVPASAVTVVPDDVPPHRAVLAGTVETAVNAVWDAAPRLGDRVAVIGAGMVGCSVAALLRSFPLARLELVDVDPGRRAVAERIGVSLVSPPDAADDCDVVVHCSAAAAGLNRGLELLGDEGELIELSWYGEREVAVSLGGAFHARRLSVRASQVGAVATSRRARRSHADRLALALELLTDPVFDELVTSRGPFSEVPVVMQRIAAGQLSGLCHVLDYAPAGRTVHPFVEET
jgi:threonine dehydrogenase-like Zn-dependent dehydrogenase